MSSRQIQRYLTHILHSTDEHHLTTSQLQRLSSKNNCLHPRSTDFIDRRRFGFRGTPSAADDLASRSLSDAGGNDLADEGFLDVRGLDAGAGNGSFSGDGA